MWWRDAVIYQIYPRSFQDADGDGVGDLQGITRRLDHLVDLGVDGLWLSPMYPSPQADFGYDVADYEGVDPAYGTLADADALIAAAHDHGLRILLDLIPCHTSIEHRWFRERPDFYVWHDGPAPPNNWIATFGGPAWTWHAERGQWYLHSFYPEQPDLDWRNPDVHEAMQGVIRFWLERGVDGFRLDAIDRIGKDPDLRDEPPRTTVPFFEGEHPEFLALEHVHALNVDGPVRAALASLREAAGDALLVGEFYLPTEDWPRYLESLDAGFAFELFFAPVPWRPDVLRRAVERAMAHEWPAWVFSNHDAPRLATRLGEEKLGVAAMLCLTLPGMAFLYQGDEIGLADGPGHDPPYDRHGRDGCRHPMQWDASPLGGFTTGEPWLALVDPEARNVAAQRGEPGSLLALHRELLALRRHLGEGIAWVPADEDVLAYRRGNHLIALNLGGTARPLPAEGETVLATHAGAVADQLLAGNAGVIMRMPGTA